MDGVCINELSVSYGNHHAISNFTTLVPGRSFVAFVGPSGCGKTTLLMVIADLLSSPGVRIGCSALTINGMSPREARTTNRIGIAFQSPGFLSWASVRENIALPLRLGRKQDIDPGTVDEAMIAVGLDGRAKHYPWQLSGGQLQRLNIARAIITQPSLLLLDEPASSLDYIARRDINKLIRLTHDRLKTTTILVTHDLQEASRLADQIVVIKGTPASAVGVVSIRDQHSIDTTGVLSPEAAAAFERKVMDEYERDR